MDPIVLIVIVVVAALLFDFVNGWNDSANAIATVVSTRVMSPAAAVLWSGALNFVGALVSTKVAKTIGGGVVSLPVSMESEVVVLAAMISAAAWAAWCTKLGLPISCSHSLIGGLTGAAVAPYGFGVLQWTGIRKILIALFASPLLGLLAAFVFLVAIYSAAVGFRSGRVRKWVLILGAGALVLAGIGVLTGQVPVGAWFKHHAASTWMCFVLPVVALAFAALFWHRGMSQHQSRRWFGPLQVCSSSFMAFQHGKNDAQKVMGVIVLALFAGGYLTDSEGRVITELSKIYVPLWVMLACGCAIALGTAIGGWKVIKTLGMKLTHLTPVDGFVAEMSAGMVLDAAAEFGVPVSTTHTITGSILGVGSAKKLKAVKWGLGAKIVYAWIFTLPVCFLLGAVFSLIAQRWGVPVLVSVAVAITIAILVQSRMSRKKWGSPDLLQSAGKS